MKSKIMGLKGVNEFTTPLYRRRRKRKLKRPIPRRKARDAEVAEGGEPRKTRMSTELLEIGTADQAKGREY